MEVGQIINLEIIESGMNGEGIAKYLDYTVFAPFALCKEIVSVKITKIQNKIAFASLVSIEKVSPQRIKPDCPYYFKCGGCALMHTDYQNQLLLKTKSIKQTLSKQLGQDIKIEQCIASENQFAYRNKIEFAVQNDKIGFYQENSHKLVEIDNCLLCDSWCSNFLDVAKQKLKNNSNIHHIVLRNLKQNKKDNLMIVFVVYKNQKFDTQSWISSLNQGFEKFSIYLNINPKENGEIFGQKFICLYGDNTQNIIEDNLFLSVSPYSFLQVNKDIQDKIYSKIIQNIDCESVVINGYSGAGYLTAKLAKTCKKIIGIEINKDANFDADTLKEKNKIENMQNICGKCEQEIPLIIKEYENQKTNFVIDPPRKGIDKIVINSLLLCKPTQIFYISCNPATLARDLACFVKDYQIDLIQPFDMFPQTKHCEVLCILKKK